MKREPLFTWYEKLSMYFVGLIVMAFIIVIGDVKAAREKTRKYKSVCSFWRKKIMNDWWWKSIIALIFFSMIIILSNNARAQSWEKIAMWVVASNLILLAAEEEEEKDCVPVYIGPGYNSDGDPISLYVEEPGCDRVDTFSNK